MERSYKGQMIVRNMNGKWIARVNGVLSQHPTLADAKSYISMMID